MKINISGSKMSSIVEIGKTLKELSEKTGKPYLALNRGVNAVCNIDLYSSQKYINFNSNEMQVYPPTKGRVELLESLNKEYFDNESDTSNFCMTNGGMNSLNIIFSTLKVKGIVSSKFYWGSYKNICNAKNINFSTYDSFEDLLENTKKYKNKAVIICDPNNPIGNSYSDSKLLEVIEHLDSNGIVTIFDSPYRKLFTDDDHDFYKKLLKFDNLIISESFSKSLGLSGLRIGFIHSTNKDFNNEVMVRLHIDSNGVSTASQLIVEKLISLPEGRKAIKEFKNTTRSGIRKNIEYLRENNLLSEKFYTESKPVGIFAIINRSYGELMDNRIGSVPLSFFTNSEVDDNLSRICVSVDHEKFKEFFDNLLNS